MISSLPKPLEILVTDEKDLLSFGSTTRLKDFCPNKIKKVVPELSFVIDSLISQIEKKKYITIDVMKHNFVNRGKTCSDVSFHVDGINNEYVIWSIGDFRTEFLMSPVFVPGLGEFSPRDLAKTIYELTQGKLFNVVEASSSVPMKYDSMCIHRGRIAEAGHKRIMVRVCSSDYIKPKNVTLRA